MVIEVNKDIDRYQESVAMGLTARQLIFSIASVVVGGGYSMKSATVMVIEKKKDILKVKVLNTKGEVLLELTV